MQPSLGRIVIYTLSANDAEQINRRRVDAARCASPTWTSGAQAHVGNGVSEGDCFPMMIVAVWAGGLVNGQVFLDGTDVFWALSRPKGETLEVCGTWAWPPRI